MPDIRRCDECGEEFDAELEGADCCQWDYCEHCVHECLQLCNICDEYYPIENQTCTNCEQDKKT